MVTTDFADNDFPSIQELTASVAAAKKKNDDDVPQPFQGRTDPYAKYKLEEYGKRLETYFAELRALEKPPNVEQWDVLKNVHNRVLVELEIKNGHLKMTNFWNQCEVWCMASQARARAKSLNGSATCLQKPWNGSMAKTFSASPFKIK